MRENQTLAGLTSRLIEKIDAVLSETQPDFVLVHGDTTTVLCAALASFYQRIPIGHVEAGLRTGNIYSPFPEEANRRLVSPLADLHFAPTEVSRQALLAERIRDDAITDRIVSEATLLLTDDAAYEAMASVANPYGDGRAAERIVEQINRFLD